MTEQPLTKAERRAAAKEARAAARRRAARRRKLAAGAGALAGVAVVAVIIATFVLVGRGDEPDDEGVAGDAAATATAPPTAASFPPLPEGADPALATRPSVSAGTGEVTELTGTTIIAGGGPATQNGQMVTVNYVGADYDTGEVFDSSWQRQEPFTFALGAGNVIPGWDRGLVGVKVGSRVQLDIPADLAYGEDPPGGQPGGALRFVVDVLAVEQ